MGRISWYDWFAARLIPESKVRYLIAAKPKTIIHSRGITVLTQERLKETLNYDPITGLFARLVNSGKTAKVGDVAGGLNGAGYVLIKISNQSYLAHRLAWFYMTGKWPKNQIDHDNHIRNDNRWLNLFEATQQENNKNRSKNKNNTSGVTGVHWHKVKNNWQANIKTGGKTRYLSSSTDKFEAICARKSAENKFNFHKNHGAI